MLKTMFHLFCGRHSALASLWFALFLTVAESSLGQDGWLEWRHSRLGVRHQITENATHILPYSCGEVSDWGLAWGGVSGGEAGDGFPVATMCTSVLRYCLSDSGQKAHHEVRRHVCI